MARTPMDEESEDALFRVFDHTQGLQRRTFRILARRFMNEHGVEEMRQQALGLLAEIDNLKRSIKLES